MLSGTKDKCYFEIKNIVNVIYFVKICLGLHLGQCLNLAFTSVSLPQFWTCIIADIVVDLEMKIIIFLVQGDQRRYNTAL